MIIIIHNGDPDVWGLIPEFLREDDPRPAKEQFDDRYVSGWCKFEGFTFDPETLTLTYPGDPPYEVQGEILFKHERLLIYPSAWVLILQPDGSWETARMD